MLAIFPAIVIAPLSSLSIYKLQLCSGAAELTLAESVAAIPADRELGKDTVLILGLAKTVIGLVARPRIVPSTVRDLRGVFIGSGV